MPAAPDDASQQLRLLGERIRSRRTTKLFLQQKVSRKLLLDAIEVARWAPNHHLTEPWHFYLLGDDTIKKCVELTRIVVTERKDASIGEFKARSAATIPGWMVVTCNKSDDELLQREDYASCCCAVQNLWLAARSEGIGVGWVSILQPARLCELLDIPETITPVAYLCLGYVDHFPEKPVLETEGWLSRRPLGEVVFSERWGQAPSLSLRENLESRNMPGHD